jgi:hypothetical protein
MALPGSLSGDSESARAGTAPTAPDPADSHSAAWPFARVSEILRSTAYEIFVGKPISTLLGSLFRRSCGVVLERTKTACFLRCG